MRKSIRAILLSASLCALGTCAFAQTQPSAVPIKRIVLYSSGVGYFQHSGTVTGDASAELQFDSGQINDVLKSLVLQDKGGTVTSVTYASQNPLARTLKSFQVDITANPTLEQLLNQLRGAKLTVTAGSDTLDGTILGVESRTKPAGDNKTYEVPVLNLITATGIRSMEIPDIRSFMLDDPKLQEELTKALAAVAQSRDQDKKPVTVHFHGSGDQQVQMGYVVETPIWKTSYRLVLQNLANGDATKPDAAPNFQGWAIIENQTDNDWTDVQLSLMSGRPISFIEDLYQPLYVPRSIVQPNLYANLQPQTYEAGMGGREMPAAAPGQAGGVGGFGGGGGRFGGLAQQQMDRMQNNTRSSNQAFAANSILATGQPATSSELNPMDSVAAIASAGQVGELFQYTIPNVTIARQSSAMLPIVSDAMGVQKVSIYNASVLPRNPLNGARLKNTTGKHLLGGPITVFDGSAYAGDAQVGDMTPDQVRFISYGVDQEMLVDTTHPNSTDDLLTGKIVKGVLEETHKQVSTSVYDVKNNASHDKTLIVEEPIQEDWNLVDSPEPKEKTSTVYRFQQSVKAGDSYKLTVKQQRVMDQSLVILDGDMDRFVFLSRNAAIPKDVKDALQKAIDMRNAVSDVRIKLTTNQNRQKALAADQTRIRENLRSVDKTTQIYDRWLKEMGDDENQLDTLKGEESDLSKQNSDKQKALEDYLAGLNVG